MSRLQPTGGKALKRLGLGLLILALPLFIRAAGPFDRHDDLTAASLNSSPDSGAHALASLNPDPPIADVQTPAPTALPSPVAETPIPADDAGIVFDTTFGDETETLPILETPALPTPGVSAEPTLEPEPESGVWQYKTDNIAIHITREQQGNFVYFAADIQLTDPAQFSYAFANERYGAGTEALSDMAERRAPLLAINGDYYSFHNNGIIIRGGELFRKKNSSRHLLIVEQNGDLSVLTDRREKQGAVANALLERNVLHTFEFGPVLVENGEAVSLHSAILRVGEGYLEPRTAIGQLGPLHYLVLVVDGRSDGYSEGCDLPTLQQLFMQYGVKTAFNLDGGGSTTLWFDGEVINQPASGDERKVSDIIMFMASP